MYACILLIQIIMGICALYLYCFSSLSWKALWDPKALYKFPISITMCHIMIPWNIHGVVPTCTSPWPKPKPETGTQWAVSSLCNPNLGSMGLEVVHCETGSQWACYNMRLVCNGPGTIWNWFTMGLLHNETGSQWAWYTMRLGHSVLHYETGTLWDWFSVDLVHLRLVHIVLHYETSSQWQWACTPMRLVHNVLHYETGSQWAWYNMRLVHNGPVSV